MEHPILERITVEYYTLDHNNVEKIIDYQTVFITFDKP